MGAPFFVYPETAMEMLPVLLGLLAAWRPAEVFPGSAPLLGTVVVVLALGIRSQPKIVSGWTAALWALAGVVVASALMGWDRGAAVPFLGLVMLACVAGWAAWERPSERAVEWLGVGLTALAVWGLIQVTWTFGLAEQAAAALPEGMRDAALYRLGTRRAVAGLALPGHLAVLLVMALALLLQRPKQGPRRWVWSSLVALNLAGILATRSLVGAALALIVVLIMSRNGFRRWAVALSILVGAVVLVSRHDLLHAAPLLQRLDNWRTALWVWSQSPWLGVGPGAFRQAAQAVPFSVRSVSAYAHSLPLQALAELGPTGLLAVAAGGVSLTRLVVRGWGRHPGLALAVAAGAVHNLVDFSCYMSGVLVPWAVLTGLLAGSLREAGVAGTALRPRTRRWLLAAAAVGLVMSLLGAESRATVESASRDNDVRAALRAVKIAPWRIPPRLAAAGLAVASGDRWAPLDAVAVSVDEGLTIAPRSAALELAAARLGLLRGDPMAATMHCRRASADRPGWGKASELCRPLMKSLEQTP